MQVHITADGKPIPLDGFAEKIIGQTVWTMVSALRGTENAVTVAVKVSFEGEAC